MSLMNPSKNAGQISQSAAISDLLETEIAHQQRHLGLLREQREALIACNRIAFKSLHNEYEDLLSDLELQADRRARIVPGGAVWLEAQMATWTEPERVQTVRLLDRLRTLLGLVRRQSAENRVLIENERSFVDFELSLIMAAVTRSEHYEMTGAPASRRANRLINRTI
jgi:hypothetical protein